MDDCSICGSLTSSTVGFVAATRPGLAVISCGPGNAFGFPSPDVVDRWRAAGADIARTDTNGAITVTIDREGALSSDRLAPGLVSWLLRKKRP